LQKIRQAKAKGLPFEVVGCDSLYGRDSQFRADLDAEDLIYMADVPADTPVYLDGPVVGVPETPSGKQGRPFSRLHVLSEGQPVEVRALVTHPDLVLQPVKIRHTERGLLTYRCAARRVWTITKAGQVREE
jgi:SRSO17 transposase